MEKETFFPKVGDLWWTIYGGRKIFLALITRVDRDRVCEFYIWDEELEYVGETDSFTPEVYEKYIRIGQAKRAE